LQQKIAEKKQVADGERQERQADRKTRVLCEERLAKKVQLAKEIDQMLSQGEEGLQKLMEEPDDDASTVASSCDDVASTVLSRKVQQVPDPCARNVVKELKHQKAPDPCARHVDEEPKAEVIKVHYFSSIEMRDWKKVDRKIRDIEKIEALLEAGKAVDPLQKAKISQKADLLKQQQYFLDKEALGWVCRPQ